MTFAAFCLLLGLIRIWTAPLVAPWKDILVFIKKMSHKQSYHHADEYSDGDRTPVSSKRSSEPSSGYGLHVWRIFLYFFAVGILLLGFIQIVFVGLDAAFTENTSTHRYFVTSIAGLAAFANGIACIVSTVYVNEKTFSTWCVIHWSAFAINLWTLAAIVSSRSLGFSIIFISTIAAVELIFNLIFTPLCTVKGLSRHRCSCC